MRFGGGGGGRRDGVERREENCFRMNESMIIHINSGLRHSRTTEVIRHALADNTQRAELIFFSLDYICSGCSRVYAGRFHEGGDYLNPWPAQSFPVGLLSEEHL